MKDAPAPTPMAPIIIGIIGFFVLLSFSGGLGGGSGIAGASFAGGDNQASTVSTTSTQTRSTGSSRSGIFGISSSNKTQATDETPVYRVPNIETLPALNIEDDTASLRGSVNMYAGEKGTVFVVYGYNLKSVRDVTKGYTMYKEIPAATSDKARTYVIDRRAKGEKEYSKRVSKLVPDVTYYYQTCVEYTDQNYDQQIKCGNVKSFSTNNSFNTNNRFYTPRASVSRAYDVTADTAVLSGRVRMNNGQDGIAFFVYGQDREQVNDAANVTTYRSVDEDGESLQAVRVGTFVRGEAEYTRTIYALDNEQLYYYRLCVEYTGDRDGVECSGVTSFTTDERNYAVLPYAETKPASVSPGKVKLSGLVQMNSYRDGVSFFVVGDDLGKVEDVIKSDSFSRIRQSGYDLQKILLNDDTDSADTYTKTIDFLEPGIYYYRTCVQYTGEDKYSREKNFLRCGAIRTFVAY